MHDGIMDASMAGMWKRLTTDERRQLLLDHKMWLGFINEPPRPSQRDCDADFVSSVARMLKEKKVSR